MDPLEVYRYLNFIGPHGLPLYGPDTLGQFMTKTIAAEAYVASMETILYGHPLDMMYLNPGEN